MVSHRGAPGIAWWGQGGCSAAHSTQDRPPPREQPGPTVPCTKGGLCCGAKRRLFGVTSVLKRSHGKTSGDRAHAGPPARGPEPGSRSSTVSHSHRPDGHQHLPRAKGEAPGSHQEHTVQWARASPVTGTHSTWFQTPVPRQAPPERPRNRTCARCRHTVCGLGLEHGGWGRGLPLRQCPVAHSPHSWGHPVCPSTSPC